MDRCNPKSYKKDDFSDEEIEEFSTLCDHFLSMGGITQEDRCWQLYLYDSYR